MSPLSLIVNNGPYILEELAQIEYALNFLEPISLEIVRTHHNKDIWRAY